MCRFSTTILMPVQLVAEGHILKQFLSSVGRHCLCVLVTEHYGD